MDDVEPSECERDREVRAHADGDADPASARDRHRRADCDELGFGAVEERPAAGGQVTRAIRRREDRDRMAEASELGRNSCDVLVDVVRLRPGERCNQADP